MGEIVCTSGLCSKNDDSLGAFDMLTPVAFNPSGRVSGPGPARIFSYLSHLEVLYPGFQQWYWKKVVPGLLDGSRRAFVEDDGRITGIVIAKFTRSERKLCTVWVDSNQAGRGIGRALMEEAMAWLCTTHPLITVPEERVPEFNALFDRWRFSLNQVVPSLYRPGFQEYVFNGTIAKNT
jgi:GNAT superfamily N-acetyltransferase